MSYGKSIDFLFNQMRNGTGSLAGGTVTFYYAGATTTLKDVYLDRDITQIAANPYTLSADGTASLFGDGLYRIVFKDSTGVTVYDYDDVALIDNSDILESITLNERDLFYQMTLGDVQFKKCYRDILDAADSFTLGGSPIPQYSALDYSLYGLTGSTAITPELIESGTYERAFLYVQADDTALLTYEYSIDGGSTWTAFTDYINVSFSSLRVKITWGGPGKLFNYGLFYDYYGALTVVPTGVYSSLGYSSIEDALVDIGTASAVLRIESAIRVGDSAQTIPSNVETQVVKIGMINLDQDLTIEGSFECGLFQCFSGTGAVVFGDGSTDTILPQWFGAAGDGATNDEAAVTAALAAGATAKVPLLFAPSAAGYNIGGTVMLARGISLIGSAAGPVQQINNKARPAYTEYWKEGYAPRGAVGALGSFEMNVSFNMDYATGIHRLYDNTQSAQWFALNETGTYLQYCPATTDAGDVWDAGGRLYNWYSLNNGDMYARGNAGFGAGPVAAARVYAKGSDTTSTAYGLYCTNSDGTELFKQSNNGYLYNIGNTGIGAAPLSTVRLYAKGETNTNAKYVLYLTNSDNTEIGYVKNNGETGFVGIYNASSASAANVVVDSNGKLWRSTSSAQYKTDIRDLPDGYLKPAARPVIYKSLAEYDGRDHLGFIAEQLDASGLIELVSYDKEGQPDGVQYDRFVVIHEARLNALETRVTMIEEKLKVLAI